MREHGIITTNGNNTKRHITMAGSKKKAAPPVLKKKETKTAKRLFRFTESNFGQLETLSERYKGDVSAIADLLVEASKEPDFLTLLDKFVAEKYVMP